MTKKPLVDDDVVLSLTNKRLSSNLLLNAIRRMPAFRQLQYWHDQIPDNSNLALYLDTMIKQMGVTLDDTAVTIPKTGPCILVGNHPTGLLEVMAWLRTILFQRPDIKFLANYWFEIFPLVKDAIISVNPFESDNDVRLNFKAFKQATRHMRQGGAIMVLPAGEVAHWRWQTRRIHDPIWKDGILSLAKCHDAPLIPCHASGQNSLLFNLSGLIHPRLRTMLLLREFVKQKNTVMQLRTGIAINRKKLAQYSEKPAQLAMLRLSVEALASQPYAQRHQAPPDIIAPIPPHELARCLQSLTPILTHKQFNVFCVKGKAIPIVMQELGRLREINYRSIHEGSHTPCDTDHFDDAYYQLILWDTEARKIHGALRIGLCDELGMDNYFVTAVHAKPEFNTIIKHAIDFGRFFVCPDAPREHNILHMLFRCLAKKLQESGQYQYLIGQVSLPTSYPQCALDLIAIYLKKYCIDDTIAGMLTPKHPYIVDTHNHALINDLIRDMPRLAQLRQAMNHIFQGAYSLPHLLRFYLQANARVLSFNEDKDFGCVDALMIMRRDHVPRHFSL